jgi:hypothetical protein
MEEKSIEGSTKINHFTILSSSISIREFYVILMLLLSLIWSAKAYIRYKLNNKLIPGLDSLVAPISKHCASLAY